jgi:hypothetical protein
MGINQNCKYFKQFILIIIIIIIFCSSEDLFTNVCSFLSLSLSVFFVKALNC